MNKKIKMLIKKLGEASLETKIIAGVLAVGVLTCGGAIVYKITQDNQSSTTNITTAANPKTEEKLEENNFRKDEEKPLEEVKKEEVTQEKPKTEELAQAESSESPNRNEEVTSSNSSASNTSSKGENSNSTSQPKVEENQQVETKKESVPEPKVEPQQPQEPQKPKEPESTQTLQQKFCAKYGLTPIEGTTSFALYRGCKINVSVDDDAYVREQMRLADERIQAKLENYNRNKKNHPEWFDSNGMPKPGTGVYEIYKQLKAAGLNP